MKKLIKRLFCKHLNYESTEEAYLMTDNITTTVKYKGCVCIDCGKRFVKWV